MGFFKNLIGRQDVLVAAQPMSVSVAAPGSALRHIGYDAKLIDSLLRGHAELGRIFGNIGESQKAGNFEDIRNLLVQFKTRLDAHLLIENVRFYNYLEQALADDVESAATIRDFRRDMNGIARSVVDFVKRYQSSRFVPAERHQFAADYAAVGKILEQRLDSEENSLYPLYRPD